MCTGRRAAVGGRLAVGSGVLGGFVPLVPLLVLGRESGNQGRRNRTTGGAWCQEEGGLVIRKECERGEAEQQYE